MRIRSLLIVAVLAGTVAAPAPVRAQAVKPPANDDCLACHGDSSAAREDGRSVAVLPESFDASVHGAAGLACVDCHADLASVTDFPHPEKLAPAQCATCHEAVVTQYRAGAHAQAIHARGASQAATCVSCHGAHEIRRKTDPASTVNRANVLGTCTKCHEGIRPAYEASVHAQAVKAGNALAPVCVDCHTTHDIGSVGTDAWKLGIIRECGTCHEQSLRSYRDTFHGKISELGFTRVAKCADCHGAHTVLPASNPASMISPQRRLSTCQQCHPSANASFARYDPHADPHDRRRNPALYFTAVFMKLLLGGVFLFFGMHALLWFPRSLQARRERTGRHHTPGPEPPARPSSREEG